MQEGFLQRIRYAMKPDEAYGLIFSWDVVVNSYNHEYLVKATFCATVVCGHSTFMEDFVWQQNLSMHLAYMYLNATNIEGSYVYP